MPSLKAFHTDFLSKTLIYGIGKVNANITKPGMTNKEKPIIATKDTIVANINTVNPMTTN